MRVVTFKVDEELLEKLDLFCINNRLFRSEVIRKAIKLYLSMSTKKNSRDLHLKKVLESIKTQEDIEK